MEKLVEEFRKFVNERWNEPLNQNTCIPIHIRKLVKSILREYIVNAPPLSDEHKNSKRPINLFLKEYVNKNPVYIELFKNNVWMLDSAVSIKEVGDINTLGRFLLIVVYRIMTGSKNDGTIMDDKDPTDPEEVDRQMDYFCYLFMWYMGSVSLYYRNKSLVIGIPMYWWRGDELLTFVHSKLDEYFSQNDPQKFSNGAVSFVRYIANTYDKIGDDFKNIPHINIAFNNFSTNFISSVPEYILDGLCYEVYDKITKHGTMFYLDIFMKPTRYNGFYFKTLDHSKHGVVDGISKSDVGDDRGAIRFTYHPSFNKRVEYVGAVDAPPVRRHPNVQEDTYTNQHNVDNKTPSLFTRNSENSGYYLRYVHYSHLEDTVNNEFERRDRLTYDEEVCTKHRFDGDIDDDKTMYYRMLRDRFMGFLGIKPPLSEVEVVGDDEDDNSMCMDINKLDRLLAPLEKSVVDRPCCSNKPVGLGSSSTTTNRYPIVRETYRPTWTRNPRDSIFTRHHPYNTYTLDNWWRQQRHGAIW
ncbi:A-type inclusion protein [Pseudocowpox virus]|uniref:A-type inclusion protein n=1 Tax=Pseudocowpox virus TaxID=129726 RepID=D3IZC0_9POXV|nr:A-type inclusion protein [Pseudocowpox virus]